MRRALVACLIGWTLTAAAARGDDRPDLFIFFSDDHSVLDCQPYGATDVRTPNMQRLADEGLLFTQAFVASPSCAPSRAAMLSGLMPARNGAEDNHSFPRDDVRLWPSYLQALGYEVAAFGKVAHGAFANRAGFDHVDPKHDAAAVERYLSGRDRAKPLCLLVGTHDPHVPWAENEGYDPQQIEVPPTHVDLPETRSMRARYYTDVTTADTELGQIRALAAKYLRPNTLTIYTSDHGAQWPFGKWTLYDAGTHVPLLAAWPGVIPPGERTDAMVSWIDLLPSFIELAGGTPPTELDGRSFAAVLRRESDTHRDEIFTTHSGDRVMNVYPSRAVRRGQYLYILNLHPEFRFTTHIDRVQDREGVLDWRSWERAAAAGNEVAAAAVRRYHLRAAEELYDVEADPHQLHNLADESSLAEVLATMRGKVRAWMQEQGDQETVFHEPQRFTPEERQRWHLTEAGFPAD